MYFDAALNFHIYLIAILISTAICGDYIVEHSNLHLHRALFDNITHALIGALSWFIVSIVHRNRYITETLIEIALCTLISSGIDLDHFFAARSLYLKDATSLKVRPPLHCTTVPLLVVFVLMLVACCQGTKWILRLSFLVLTAFISHHTRDAVRRGFWLYPYGSTKPIPYFAYILLTVVVPYAVCVFIHFAPIQKSHDVPITV